MYCSGTVCGCTRTRAHAHACAANYVLGTAGTDNCPAGYSKIAYAETEATCKVAAAFLGRTYLSSVSLPYRPSGCYLDTATNKVSLNTDRAGFPYPNTQPLCKVNGALPHSAARRTPHGYTVGWSV